MKIQGHETQKFVVIHLRQQPLAAPFQQPVLSAFLSSITAYWPLIYRVALKAGLNDAEAQDVVQETVIAAAKHLPGFHYDPKVCSFKTWLLRLTRWRIIDQLRKRLPGGQRVELAAEDDTTATAALDRLTGGVAPGLEAVWREEWEKLVLAAALERVKQLVRPEQFQMFDLYALKGIPVDQAANLLGVSVARVYLAKHRVSILVEKRGPEVGARTVG